MPKKCFVERRHFLRADQADFQFAMLDSQFRQNYRDNFFQQPRINFFTRWRLAMTMFIRFLSCRDVLRKPK